MESMDLRIHFGIRAKLVKLFKNLYLDQEPRNKKNIPDLCKIHQLKEKKEDFEYRSDSLKFESRTSKTQTKIKQKVKHYMRTLTQELDKFPS